MLLTSKSDLANYIYDHPNELALDLQGIFIADRECLSLRLAMVYHLTSIVSVSCSRMVRSSTTNPRG